MEVKAHRTDKTPKTLRLEINDNGFILKYNDKWVIDASLIKDCGKFQLGHVYEDGRNQYTITNNLLEDYNVNFEVEMKVE
jgi:hypothetical protein